MDHVMDLPPPAPPDAFSLDDDDTGLTMQQQGANAEPPGPSLTLGQTQAPTGVHAADSTTAELQQQQTAKQMPHSASKVPQQLMHAPAAATAPTTGAGTELLCQLTTPPALSHADQQQHAPNQQHAQIPPQQQPKPAQQQEQQAQQQQQRQQQGICGRKQQPRDLTGVLSQLSDNSEAIAAAEEMLENLLARQATLHHMGRKMEQQQVLTVLQQGQLGFHRGRPVAAVLVYRCLQHWGLLHQTEPCPFLEQLSSVLQDQLDLDDASAPAEVAGLQCHVAHSLTLCAVLYCVLLKASQPELAAAAAVDRRGVQKQQHSAAEVVAAVGKKVSATWQQSVAHMGPGLQALGKLKIGGWGFAKRTEDSAAAAAAAAAESPGNQQSGSNASTQSSQIHQPLVSEQTTDQEISPADTAAAEAAAAAADVRPSHVDAGAATAPAAVGGSRDSAVAAAVSMDSSVHSAAPLGAFVLCLDLLVQHTYVILRDQLKRRLTPLLAECVSPDNEFGEPGAANASSSCCSAGFPHTQAAAAAAGDGARAGDKPQHGGDWVQGQQPISPSAAGAAVAGAAAQSPAHAEAALMNYHSWSELVGVLHAALVALRGAHVPRALRAGLMQQVLEFVNCQLFNQLLLRPECCSVSNARYALRGLKQLDTWIIAEQTASHHDMANRAHSSHTVVGTGSIHSSSFNSQSTAAAAAAAAVPGGGTAAAAGGGARVGGDSTVAAVIQDSTVAGSTAAAAAAAGNDSHRVAAGKQGNAPPAPAAAAAAAAPAAAAAGEDEDAGWEQVPADSGDFDSWRPHKQQQQQQQGGGSQPWWHWHKQEEGHREAGEQPELGPEAWNALAHVRQALQFLVFENKGDLSLQDLTEHLCPSLNHQQLYRLCTTAWSSSTDEDAAAAGVRSSGGGGVSGEVLEQMKQQYMLQSNGGLIVTFLLDEPSGPLPFMQPPAAAAAVAAAGSSGSSAARCHPSAVVTWDDGRDYGVGLKPVPAALVGEGCPAEVFEFLTIDQAWPPGRHCS